MSGNAPGLPEDTTTPIDARVADTAMIVGSLGYALPHTKATHSAEAMIALTEDPLQGLTLLAGIGVVLHTETDRTHNTEVRWRACWAQCPPPDRETAEAAITRIHALPGSLDRAILTHQRDRMMKALQIAAHLHWTEGGATPAQTLHGARISTTDWLDDAVTVQIGLGAWLEVFGIRHAPTSNPWRWIDACERHVCRHLANAPGRAWRGTSLGGHLFGAGAAMAPRTVLVLDEVQSVADVTAWAKSMIHDRAELTSVPPSRE